MKKGDMRFLALVVVGGIITGFMFKAFPDAPVIGDARDGFTG